MLMKFSVSNYMSFGYKENESGEVCPVEFHLYAGSSQQFKNRIISYGNRNVLKFSAIYGANASGKSNLVSAIDCGRRIVLSTMQNDNLKNKYCRSLNQNKLRPTQFEYEFSIKDKCYAYGFTVSMFEQKVLSEWLYELDNGKENVVFERSEELNEYYFDEERFVDLENVQQFHFFLKDVNRIQNSLLLYELERRNMDHIDFEIFHQIYEWFEKKLVVIYPDTRIGASYVRFEKTNEDLVKILKYLDTGITDYHMQKMNKNAFREYFSDTSLADRILKSKGPDNSSQKSIFIYGKTLFEIQYEKEEKSIFKLQFKHGNDDSYYEYGEESDGTQRLIELLDVILNDDEEKVFVIDELDRSLHPQMTRKFVETFMKFSEEKNTQLIITTHESNLMDLEMLRRDEIWFAEREADNTTTLCTLEKFKVRYDKVVSKDYLAGRYGGVPVFKDFEYVWGRNDECSD